MSKNLNQNTTKEDNNSQLEMQREEIKQIDDANEENINNQTKIDEIKRYIIGDSEYIKICDIEKEENSENIYTLKLEPTDKSKLFEIDKELSYRAFIKSIDLKPLRNDNQHEFRCQYSNKINDSDIALSYDMANRIGSYIQSNKQFIIAWGYERSKYWDYSKDSEINTKAINDIVENDIVKITKDEDLKIKIGTINATINLNYKSGPNYEHNIKVVENLNKYGFAQGKYNLGTISVIDKNGNKVEKVEYKDIKYFEDMLNNNIYYCIFESKYLPYYLINNKRLHKEELSENEIKLLSGAVGKSSINSESSEKDRLIKLRNRILLGAPGTGKSNKIIEDMKLVGFEEIKRVTFYPTYTYGQFVGTYKPTPIYSDTPAKSNEKLYDADQSTKIEKYMRPIIDYKLVAGPFLELLCKAIRDENKGKKYLLIIEELNRGNVASIFGDVFQLLDRNSDGSSEYGITFNKDIMTYISKETDLNVNDTIYLPKNMYIWCTMNSADECVTKLDTAFKRRWNFEYMHINGENKSRGFINTLEIKTNFKCLGNSIEERTLYWNEFRKRINEKLIDVCNIPEDKLIGPFFMRENELNDENSLIDKLVLYLKDDVLRYNSDKFFKKKTFFEISDDYKDNGENIFLENIFSDEELKKMSIKYSVINNNDHLEVKKDVQ